MRSVLLHLVLLGFIMGTQAEDGDLHSKCASGNTCKDSNAYCDTTDAENTKCMCNTNWVKKGNVCVRGANQVCGNSQCLKYGACSADGTCGCDTTKGYAPGSADDSKCSCPAGHVARESDGMCVKVIGQTCSKTSECITNAVCSTTCQCDTSKHYAAGSNGATSCSCDTSKAMADTETGTCRLKVGQDCSNADQCVAATGMTCTDGKCACDTSKHFAAGTAGAVTCSCEANYGEKADKTCGKLVGQQCASGDTCVDHATCSSSTCTCDSSASWVASSTNFCECNPDSHVIKSDGMCGKKIGETCEADAECIDYATCQEKACKCDPNANRATNAADGDSQCLCDLDSVMRSGVCRKKVGQECSSVDQCISTPGMVCETVDNTKKCTCNTAKYYAAGENRDIACECVSTNYTSQSDGSCALNVGQACSSKSAPCVMGAVCDEQSSTCVCDASSNFKVTSGGNACECADNAVTITGTSYCGLKVGGTCTPPDNADVCTDHASCSLDTDLGVSTCKCSGSTNSDGTCNGSGGIAASILVLMGALLMTSRLL